MSRSSSSSALSSLPVSWTAKSPRRVDQALDPDLPSLHGLAPEIARHAIPEAHRLAHVERPALAVQESIDPGRLGRLFSDPRAQGVAPGLRRAHDRPPFRRRAFRAGRSKTRPPRVTFTVGGKISRRRGVASRAASSGGQGRLGGEAYDRVGIHGARPVLEEGVEPLGREAPVQRQVLHGPRGQGPESQTRKAPRPRLPGSHGEGQVHETLGLVPLGEGGPLYRSGIDEGTWPTAVRAGQLDHLMPVDVARHDMNRAEPHRSPFANPGPSKTRLSSRRRRKKGNNRENPPASPLR